MGRRLAAVLVLLVGLAPAWAQDRVPETTGKVLHEAWYEAKTEQGKLGHVHFVAREVERAGQKLIRTTMREETSYLRSGDPYQDTQEQETLETPTGRVLEVSYGISLSKTQKLKLVGTPQGDQLTFRIADSKLPYVQTIPWDARALGLYAMETHFHGKKLVAGEAVTLLSFNPAVNRIVPITMTVKGEEEVKLHGGTKRLTRVEQTFPKESYLPKGMIWLDDAGKVVRMQDEDTLLFGTLVRELASRDEATAPFKAKVADKEAPVLVDKRITIRRGRPTELRLRIGVENEDRPINLFPQNGRQIVVKADDKAVELRVLKNPVSVFGPPAEADPEYLESNFFIRSDDERVRRYAREAIGDEKDPRQRMSKIKRWVRTRVRGCYEIAFASADEVARTLEGDCSEIGVLTAAMCRAAGIPSRVAFGLVYDPEHVGFGGHLWCEVYLDGAWEPCDATGVVDAVQAAYLCVGSFSLKGILNPDEMIEVRRAFAGQMRVEVLDQK